MPSKIVLLMTFGLGWLVAVPVASGHVPYLEVNDFSAQDPFVVTWKIEQSIAVYSWLEVAGDRTDDVDVYWFTIDKPTDVFIESLVPACPGYEDFLPWFAVVGPGLPEPEVEVPFDIPAGQGAVVIANLDPGQERTRFFEPFGGKSYYDGPEFSQTLSEPGTYHVIYWDPAGHGGDYVAVLGDQEIWRFRDIFRALINTFKIRRDMELHVDCP